VLLNEVPFTLEAMMTTQALFIDLPNFTSGLLRSGIVDAESLREYFLYWLDFDRLARKLTGKFSAVWVFYSGRRVGPKPYRIQDELGEYIERINSLKGVTARDVDIPGKQREHATYQCENCGHEGTTGQWETEKGIDASLTVHLFDTMDTWDIAYLLSGDADFVPAVASLRRRGKIVVGAGFSDTSSALVRECYDYVDLCDIFLKEDVAAFEIFKTDGIVRNWLTEEVQLKYSGHEQNPVKLTFEWQSPHRMISDRVASLQSMDEISDNDRCYRIYLLADGPIDLSSRHQQIEYFEAKFPRQVSEKDLARGKYQLIICPLAWNGVQRRLESFASSLEATEVYEARVPGKGYTAKYRYNSSTGRYEMMRR
jgi:uncharacterized LabA/DUF88 family protein